tara:strand:- start:1722 stop:4610 length:2889 start_codon:yes stop_codon:yes gene_type:complete
MSLKQSIKFEKGDRVSHFKHGNGVVQRVLSGGTLDVKFASRNEYVQSSNVKNLDVEIKKSKARQARIQRERIEKEQREEDKRKAREKEELDQAKKKVMYKSIDKLMNSNFLSVDEYYVENCKGVISQKEFDNRKIQFVKSWLAENIPPSKNKAPNLDDDQALAVASVVGNIQVIARAGSGKTTTLVLRTFFLIKHCAVNADQILLLAFNKKAATEVKKRLLLLLHSKADAQLITTINSYKSNKSTFIRNKAELEIKAVAKVAMLLDLSLPYVMTFHALAYAIVHPEEAPLHDNETDQSLSRHTQQIIDDYLRDDKQHNLIKELMMAHFKEDWDKIISGGFHHNKEEFLLFRRSLPQQSLRGEYVKSYGEKLIADFLFEHDVNYKYERNHYWNNVNYRPDFTLFTSDKSGLIIEYFGLSGDPDYDEMSEQKKLYWENKSNWDLLSYTPIDITNNGPESFKDKLKEDIELRGFICNKLSDEEIWLRCKERAIDRFTGAMVSFIGRCRKLSLSYEDLLARCQNYSAEADVERQFLNFACKFYCDYLGALTETGNDDFDGLIQKAVTELKQGNTLFESTSQSGNLSNIKYISIDEYQDFSLLFNNLIQSIIVNTDKVNLFCVGDDWQAINGFAGSDLIYFNQISEFIDSPRTLHMPTNYRSPDGIVSIGNTLMTGLGKPAESHHKEACDIKLVDLDSFQPTRIEAARHSGDNITPVVLRLVNESLNRNQDVVLLCRKNSINGYVYEAASEVSLERGRGIARYLQFIHSFFPKDLRGRITISTAHKYKGLEKPTVIVMDLVKRSYPLVHPDWVFTRVFGDNLQSITEEERRLLYVALTRTEKDLYIITDKKEPSPFLANLEKNSNVASIDWQKFSPFVAEGQVRQVTLKVSNNGFGYNERKGTVPIKDMLIASGYRYQSSSFSWAKVFLREGFSSETIKSEVWFKQAIEVKLEIYDDTEQLVGNFVI